MQSRHRENLGMEFDRNWRGAETSLEPSNSTLESQWPLLHRFNNTHGSTMRLGSRKTFFQTPDCITAKLYGNPQYVDERHRHRYEILELPSHSFYIGVQFHPEFKSRPRRPSPLFLGFILAATGKLEGYLNNHQNGV
ncbi:hypothetical protein GH714_022788 [Hevea brasiliensis]|uniref:CTP synthase (glutamine hydrolyzing) n=1 Tax=Hevea brasiliensis TaxID=3981 RepID=A0A6A6NIR4_HEVBR|nr:hypothetical protein GH714_022788 [Hevea brasiliensis]